MTAKRYDVIDKEEPRRQSVTYEGILCTARTCVTRLNRLTDENEQLKNEIEKIAYANEDLLKEKREWKKLSDEYAKIYDENKKLKQENEQLKQQIADWETSFDLLKHKNEELKKEIKEKEEVIKFYHRFNRGVDDDL